MKYKITTQVTEEPISLEDAMKHLRVEPFGYPLCHPDEEYISSLISVSREWCEQYIRRALATQTVTLALSEFPIDGIRLPLLPIQSVTSINYLDKNNALQTFSSANYYVDYFDGVIYLDEGASWPEISLRENSIMINYVAGYTATTGENLTPLPNPIRAAIMLMIGSFYENRQEDQLGSTKVTFNSLPMGVYNLLQPYRLNLGV